MKKTCLNLFVGIIALSLAFSTTSYACTNFLVTKGASKDGSTMISYAADSHTLYGELYYLPAADYPKGAMLKIYEWDTGKLLGEIEQVRHTYSVVGNMNEHQLAIGETTYGGRDGLSDSTGIMDYGSLIYTTLQRAKTAREAIKVIGELLEKYGYYSSGESFSIADPNEVWIMELIGKGVGNKGAVWVARRIPEGYVCAHANQARITTFPLNDKENCIYAPDVISFAREKGWFKGEDKDFSFSDTYAPVKFGGARFCEVRVWAFFRQLNKEMDQHLNYVKGHVIKGENDYATNRMPLWIKADRKIDAHDVMNFMRDHLEETELDMRKDIGAGPFERPYRWRGLTWKVDDVKYCNERATATQQTGFSFVSQSRSWLPNPIGGILWFGVDDAASSVYVPMYCGINKIAKSFAVGNGDMLTYSDDAAFWIFNSVSNFTYLRYNYIIKDVKELQQALELKYIEDIASIDKQAVELYNKDKNAAQEFITNYSVETANTTVDKWKELRNFLLVKYIDGNIKKEENGKFLRTKDGMAVSPNQPGYPDWWKRLILKQTGDKFKVIGDDGH